MADVSSTGIMPMMMMVVMVLIVADFVSTVVKFIEVVLVCFFYVGIFDDVEIFSNVVAWLVLPYHRAVTMEIVISFVVVIVIVVANLVGWLTVMVAMVTSANVIIVDIVVFVSNLHMRLLL